MHRAGKYVIHLDPVARTVVTVGIQGMTGAEWREVESRAIDVAQEQALAAPQRRQRRTPAPAPEPRRVQARHPLDGLTHKGIRATIEKELEGHWHEYEIRVLSPTQVTYWRKDQ